MLPITRWGTPVMHAPTRRVTVFDDHLHQLVKDMFATMQAAEGVGLAANQVGVDLAVFVFDCPDDDHQRHAEYLYGIQLVRRNRICAPEGVRWACGQRAFIAMRGLLEGQSISCSFIAAAGSPKAVCRVGDTDVTQWLLSQGWAELAEGVTDETYAEAAASARRRKVGIWGDGPP